MVQEAPVLSIEKLVVAAGESCVDADGYAPQLAVDVAEDTVLQLDRGVPVLFK